MSHATHSRRETAHNTLRVVAAVLAVLMLLGPMLTGSAVAQADNETNPCAFGPPVPGQQDETEQLDELELSLILDESTSMTDETLADMKNGSTSFVGRLSGMDEAGVVTIDATSQILLNLTRDYDAVNSTIDGIQVEGSNGNDPAGALNNSESVLFDRENATDGAVKTIVIATDGDLASPVAADVGEALRDRGVLIYAIAFGADADVGGLADITGGTDRVYVEPDSDELADIYEEVRTDIEEDVEELQTGRLRIDTRPLFEPGAEHPYEVANVTYVVQDNETDTIRTDVTDAANLTSSDTSVLSVDEPNTQLVATDDPDTATWVRVDAETANRSGCTNVIVAEPTVENLELVPGIHRVEAVAGDSTLFALLIATLLAVPAARFTSAFGGLAVAQMTLVVGWFAGYVGFGTAAASLFVALFIGLNLAANIDYSAGRLSR